jgi:hypothetical protein
MPGLPLFLQANTMVQRQEAASLPPLTLPPLTPPQPFGAKKAGTGLLGNAPQLTLDPQIQLYLIEKLFAARLTPFDLRAALRSALLNPSTPICDCLGSICHRRARRLGLQPYQFRRHSPRHPARPTKWKHIAQPTKP